MIHNIPVLEHRFDMSQKKLSAKSTIKTVERGVKQFKVNNEVTIALNVFHTLAIVSIVKCNSVNTGWLGLLLNI